jgi:hypothetical protein
MVRRMNCTFKQIYTTEEVDTQDRSDYQARLYKVLDVGARAICLYLPFASQAICSQCAGVLFLVAEAPPSAMDLLCDLLYHRIICALTIISCNTRRIQLLPHVSVRS